MTRKRSLTSQLYRAARTSNNLRAMSRGPNAYAKRVVRRKVYSKQMGLTRSILKTFGTVRVNLSETISSLKVMKRW